MSISVTHRCRKGHEGEVDLKDQDPKVFGYFVSFLYYLMFETAEWTDGDGIDVYAKAWVLGEYLDAPEFKNFAMR